MLTTATYQSSRRWDRSLAPKPFTFIPARYRAERKIEVLEAMMVDFPPELRSVAESAIRKLRVRGSVR